MAEVVEMEKPREVVKRLLDGRPLRWLAARSGVSYRRLVYLLAENGPVPEYPEAVAIGKALGVEPSAIFGGAE